MNLLKRIVGDDRAHLLDVCNRTIFFCQMDKPAVSYNKIVLVTPPHSELEPTFGLWAERIIRLGKELSIDIEMFGTQSCLERFQKVGNANKLDFSIHLKEIESTEDFFLHYVKSDANLIVFCSSRAGSVSYEPLIESFGQKIEKACPKNDTIFIYPGMDTENYYSTYQDISANPISAGVETIQKIGREVGNIFKKSEENEDK
jgi:hypothetical protein